MGKESTCNAGDMGLIPGSGRTAGEGNGNPVFLSEKSHGQKSLAGCSLWGHKELDTTKRLTLYFRTKHNSLEKVKTCPVEVILLEGKGPMKGIVRK